MRAPPSPAARSLLMTTRARCARRAPVILSVPFRNQSETLNNLKDALTPGQLLIDATVPLAAAVSGKATRMLGVWQGSAAQQAAEMARPACGWSPRCTRSAPPR